MSSDMTIDIFAYSSYGKIALRKFGNVSENFRLFYAGWLGTGKEREVMKISGAEFRIAKSGKNKGKLSIIIKNTIKTCYITKKEMEKENE